MKFPFLQALRGLAALLVLFLHVAGGAEEYYGATSYHRFFFMGHKGVDIFFVISGFIMMVAHEKDFGNPTRWMSYMTKRVRRIYPAYWVMFSVVLIAYLVQGRVGSGASEFTFNDVMQSFLLLPQNKRTILVISWTLVYEMLFYLLFSFWILSKRWGAAISGTWLLAIFVSQFSEIPFLPEQAVNRHNLEFFIGIAAAIVLKRHVASADVWCLIAALLFICGAILLANDLSCFWIFPLSTALFIVGASHSQRIDKWIPNWLLALGDRSYSLYLVHTPVQLLTYKLLLKVGVTSPLVAFLCALGASIATSMLFYIYVERRFMRTGAKKSEAMGRSFGA
jgi:exopolysaccharide production protein ExoZ